MQEIKERAKELLASGQVQRVLGWKRGEDCLYAYTDFDTGYYCRCTFCGCA